MTLLEKLEHLKEELLSVDDFGDKTIDDDGIEDAFNRIIEDVEYLQEQLKNAKEITKHSPNEIVLWKQKAESWDAMAVDIAKCYEDDSEADLGDIGEKAAIHLGYL